MTKFPGIELGEELPGIAVALRGLGGVIGCQEQGFVVWK